MAYMQTEEVDEQEDECDADAGASEEQDERLAEEDAFERART